MVNFVSTIIKILLLVPSTLAAFGIVGKIPPLFLYGLISLQWLTIITVSFLPLMLFGKTWTDRFSRYMGVLAVFILLHSMLTYSDQKKIPIKIGMSAHQVHHILGEGRRFESSQVVARIEGVSFASFKISNYCEAVPYKDGVLYIYFNGHEQVERVFKGRT